jgi:hypothetical protein
MGEIADMMIEGDLCSQCGEYMEGGAGYARLCYGCRQEEKREKRNKNIIRRPAKKGKDVTTKGKEHRSL